MGVTPDRISRQGEALRRELEEDRADAGGTPGARRAVTKSDQVTAKQTKRQKRRKAAGRGDAPRAPKANS